MPYLRVTRGRIEPARFDEVNALGPKVAAAIRQLPGNQGWVVGTDRASGRVLTVSTWNTEENARRNNLAGSNLAARIQALGVQMDPPEVFEVTSPI